MRHVSNIMTLTRCKTAFLLSPFLLGFVFIGNKPCQAQSDPADAVVKEMQKRDQSLTAASALCLNHFYAPENEGMAEKVAAKSVPGVHLGFIGNGDFQSVMAFDEAIEAVGGGRLQGTPYDKKNTKVSLLKGDRTVYDKDNVYHVVMKLNLNEANRDTLKRSALGLRDFGWRVPFTNDLVAEGIKSGKYRYVKSEADQDNSNNTEYIRHFWLAPQHGYLVVRGYASGGNSLSTFQMKQMTQVSGFWLPQNCVLEGRQGVGGEKKFILTDTYELSELAVGSLPKDAWAAVMRFERIVNGKTGKFYKVSPTGERILLSSGPQTAGMGFGWLYMASVTTLIVLTVGAYIRWKQKQSPVQG